MMLDLMGTHYNTFMLRLYMLEKAAFPFSLKITILKTITNSFMQRMHMLGKMASPFRLIVKVE